MDTGLFEKLLKDLSEFEQGLEVKQVKLFQVELLNHAIRRLGSYSDDCKECAKHLVELNNNIEKLKKKNGQFEKVDFKDYRQLLNTITTHLQKEHKLVTQGYYMTIFMLIGMSIGLLFSLTMSWNIATGISFGMLFGLVIGMMMDEDAEKKGLVILPMYYYPEKKF